MPPSENDETDRFFDVTPYLKLFIDKDGRWFQNGAEIIHPEIYLYFNSVLEKSPAGEYRIRCAREICRVEVEDAPFVVHRVVEHDQGRIRLELNDRTVESFQPERFWIGKNNVPYVEVKGGAFHARFSRPAYYQLARHIHSDETETAFYFEMDGKRTRIRITDP